MGSTFTTAFPVLTSTACSSTPSPDHLGPGVNKLNENKSITALLELNSDGIEGLFNELADRVRFARREDEVLRGILLKHKPHPLNVIAS